VFSDKNGVAIWKSTFDGTAIKELVQANEFLIKMVEEQVKCGKFYLSGHTSYDSKYNGIEVTEKSETPDGLLRVVIKN